MSQISGDRAKKKFILSVDVGTTTIRSHVYNDQAKIIGSAKAINTLINPFHGHVELDPDELFKIFIHVIEESVSNAGISFESISSLGISAMRGTFITWNSDTGNHYHNLITWQDTRSKEICNEWNNSYQLKVVRGVGSISYFLTRQKRFLAASIFQMSTSMVLPRLIWVLNHNVQLKQDVIKGKALFGTLDTWLVWKLTKGKVHATEPSNICTTGFFDPFKMEYGRWALIMFDIPKAILPEIRETNSGFGKIDETFFGKGIEISCVIGDQQAAMFGECCFNPGDIKITLGTGSFVNVNTGSFPFASCLGLYPIVGWKLSTNTEQETIVGWKLGTNTGLEKSEQKGSSSEKEGEKENDVNGRQSNVKKRENQSESNVTYLVEGGSHDTGTAIDWMKSIGLIGSPEESCNEAINADPIVSNVSNHVHFIPAFNGLQAPYNDPSASCGFIGITSKTTKEELIRSVLQSISFRIRQLVFIVKEEVGVKLSRTISVNGGVANNDFVCQSIANNLGTVVVRDKHREMSSRGVAFICGLTKGFWTMEQLHNFKEKDRIFEPKETENRLESNELNTKKFETNESNMKELETNESNTNEEFNSWTRAVSRFLDWKQ